jgi:serine-type D-Ala-D-Ala endopeptidase (penicillin-binding protein 7)
MQAPHCGTALRESWRRVVASGGLSVTIPAGPSALSSLGGCVNRAETRRISVGLCALVLFMGCAVATPVDAAQKKAPAKTTARKASGSSTKLYSTNRTRRAALSRARAAAMAREIADTVVPRYKVDASGDLVPDLRAAAAIVYNPETNEILWEQNAQDQRSIASITKVMTATVFLENNPDLSQQVTVARSDVLRASTTYLRANDKLTTGDLLHLLLIASDNAAARALARVSPWGSDSFIDRMNDKALELGLQSTHYADPSGLLSENVSSAYDMARLITLASEDERISSVMQTSSYTVHAQRRDITFRSTNHLLGRDDLSVKAAKTGFISKSGYCLATLLRLPESDQEVAVVVLGARSNAGRFLETQNLFNWFAAKASTIFATATPAAQQN